MLTLAHVTHIQYSVAWVLLYTDLIHFSRDLWWQLPRSCFMQSQRANPALQWRFAKGLLPHGWAQCFVCNDK